MSNTIALAKQFVPLLDETYQLSSLTAILDGQSELARQGANANELIIPMMAMQGLGDYSRNSGYVEGDVTLTNETVTCNFDRGRMFTVDTMDDLETAGIAFGRLAGEFIRTKVVPELDAFRLSSYASAAGVSKATGTLATGEAAVAAIRAAVTKMDEDEVPLTERYLYITPTLHGLISDMDTRAGRCWPDSPPWWTCPRPGSTPRSPRSPARSSPGAPVRRPPPPMRPPAATPRRRRARTSTLW